MKVYIAFFQVQSWEYGPPNTQMYFFKTEEKAIEKANQLHDQWSHHKYKRTEQHYDPEEKKWLLKDCTKCYEKDNPERYRECFFNVPSLTKEQPVWKKKRILHQNFNL